MDMRGGDESEGLGKTDKLILANARRRLSAGMKHEGVTGRFEYIEEVKPCSR